MSGEPRPLQPGLPALDAFPGKVWNRLVSHRARSGERAMLAYPDPAGYRPLREHIATYLGLSRGVTCLPEQVFVTGGYRATLELVLRSLARPNDRVWFEDPGYLLARGFLAETGVQLVPVPVDGEGIDVERGTLLDAQARFARGHAVASEPARAHAVARKTHGAAGLGRESVQLDHRGRLRQRVPLSGPAIAGFEEPRPARSRDLLRHVQQGDVSRFAARVCGGAGAGRRARRAGGAQHERRIADAVAGGRGGFHRAGAFCAASEAHACVVQPSGAC